MVVTRPHHAYGSLTRSQTGHFKAVITKPQNVFVMRDIACAGYVAGGNCLFFGRGAKVNPAVPDAYGVGKQVGSYASADVRSQMQDRLAFTQSVGAKYASMLAFPMFQDQMDSTMSSLDTVMSVTSRLLPWEINGTGSAGNHDSFPGGQQVFLKYKDALQLHTVHFGEDLRAAESALQPPNRRA